ncbi:MAG: S41 family peptidase [Polyangiales bacterium]
MKSRWTAPAWWLAASFLASASACAHGGAGAMAPHGPSPLVAEARRILLGEHYLARGALETAGLDESADPHAAIRAMIAALHDPATRLLEPNGMAQLQLDLSEATSIGVGLPELLSIDLDEGRECAPTIVTPQPNTSAARAGLLPHDRIVDVDGFPTRCDLDDVMERLRGQAGVPVRLSLERGGVRSLVTLEREKLAARPASVRAGATTLDGVSVLHVAIDAFARDTVEGLVAALASANGLPVILDLRNDPGGQVPVALAALGAFFGEVDVIQMVRAHDERESLRATGAARLPMPKAILIGEGTASTAELFAAAMRDVGHVRLVGRRTFGKGLVHAGFPLSDGAVLFVSIGALRTLSNQPILGQGLEPDVDVAWSDGLRVPVAVPGTAADVQFAAAVRK